MRRDDDEKTNFHTDRGTFCYQKMPFSLKNIGVTYQHLMDKVFIENVDVYVDDMLIKSRSEAILLCDVEETLQTLTQA